MGCREFEEVGREVAVWKPPLSGLFKINCDAFIDLVGQIVRVGIVICDETGFVMASSSQRITAIYTPQVADVVAILRGLQLAIDTCIHPVVVESDATIVVGYINDGKVLNSYAGFVISEILSLI